MLAVISQQVNVVNTHLHSLELVQQGQGAKLPDSDELTADAVKAEEFLAELQADSEIAGSVGALGPPALTDEEQALFEELEREVRQARRRPQSPPTQASKHRRRRTPAEPPANIAENDPSQPAQPRHRESPEPCSNPRDSRTTLAPNRRGERYTHGADRQNLRPKKTLSELDKQELRSEEILIGKQRDRLFKKIEDIATAKQKIFQQGADAKIPRAPQGPRQEFELKSQEQVMAARELNLRTQGAA